MLPTSDQYRGYVWGTVDFILVGATVAVATRSASIGVADLWRQPEAVSAGPQALGFAASELPSVDLRPTVGLRSSGRSHLYAVEPTPARRLSSRSWFCCAGRSEAFGGKPRSG